MDSSLILPEEFELFDAETDLAFWEIVNASDAESTDDVNSLLSFSSWSSDMSDSDEPIKLEDEPKIDEGSVHDHADGDDVDDDDDDREVLERYILGDQCDDDEDDDLGNELNDELVPWCVSAKLGRQRMRKLGKRGFAKMNNSKRLPYSFVKAGCVHGKHGLGLKHNY